jgi:5'(3')-deoxyribonucleotidase
LVDQTGQIGVKVKTIVWDVDDVLNDLMRVWYEEFWLPAHPNLRLKYNEIDVNPVHPLLNVSKEEYLASLDDFRLSGRYDNLKPLKDVNDWFVEYGPKCRHVALTRVPVAVSHVSAAWVMKKFGVWIRSFHFISSYRRGETAPVYDEDKGTYLHYFGKADLLIDDTMENVEAAEKAGIKTLVFPRPWNKSKLTVAQALAAVSEVIKS